MIWKNINHKKIIKLQSKKVKDNETGNQSLKM